MADTDVVLWKGSLTQALVSRAGANSPIIQSRFFIPSEVLVSRYGVVGMLIVDSKPDHRKVSYTNTEWIGLDCTEDSLEFKDYDPVRRAHFVGTERGLSIIRVFGLPSQVADVFEKDSFLGEPMIAKCACDRTFDVEFDEEPAKFNWNPVDGAMPLIQTVALAGWESAGLPHDTVKQWRQFRTWLSFHGWFAFEQAVGQAQQSLERAIYNFDNFLQRMAPRVQPYSSNLLLGRQAETLPDKP